MSFSDTLKDLVSPAVQQPNNGASYGDILKGLFVRAAEGAIDKEFGAASYSPARPEASPPKGDDEIIIDTAVGERRKNRNESGFSQQQLLLGGGAALVLVLVVAVVAQAGRK